MAATADHRSDDYPRSYYAATANAHPLHPPLAGEVRADVVVVGAGFTGLSAALHLAERGYQVVVLEAHRVGWGASGRNGGQLGSGQRIAAPDLVERFGRETARTLWAMAEEAKAIVRERVRSHDIKCDLRDGLLTAATKPGHMKWLEEEQAVREREFGYTRSHLVARAEVGAYVASERYYGGLFDAGAGHLHPLNYALGLADAALAAGVRIFETSAVTTHAESARGVVANTAGGRVLADHLVLACNGYLERLEPRIAAKIMPIRNYIIATAPLGARAQALIPADCAVHDTRFVVDYYRLSADGRLLFGGGETYGRDDPRDIKAFVRPYMLRVFPQLADVAIDYGWGGQLAITLSRLPHFGRLGRVVFAHGFSGHGVALTALAGKLIAEALAGTVERFDVFARLPHRDFPGGTWLRRPAQVLGMLYYALRDRL